MVTETEYLNALNEIERSGAAGVTEWIISSVGPTKVGEITLTAELQLLIQIIENQKRLSIVLRRILQQHPWVLDEGTNSARLWFPTETELSEEMSS